MFIENDVKLDFKDVLLKPKRSTLSSRKEVSLLRTYKFKHSQAEYTGIPIMAANMDSVGTFEMAKALQKEKLFTCLVKNLNINDWKNHISLLDFNHLAVSTGTSDLDFNNLTLILTGIETIKYICVDVANGYSQHFGNFIEKVRTKFPKHTIIAGNVVTADMTQELVLRGADIIKIGIGSGAVCTTRLIAGVGYPQLSAIIECADAAHGLGAHIISDGGCTCPGDVAKAFGAGADFVMLGSMLAGHDEGNGEIIETVYQSTEQDVISIGETREEELSMPHLRYHPKYETKKFVQFYGMSSNTAMKKNYGSVAEYRSSEGRTVKIPYKGSVNVTVSEILGGLRSACTYVGATTIKQLSKCTTFIRCSQTHNPVYEKYTTGK